MRMKAFLLASCLIAAPAVAQDVLGPLQFGASGSSSSGGGGVTSITGTAAQISASASTGAVTLSLPAAVQTTSLALGGATIGTDNLGVTGAATFSGSVTAGLFSPTSSTVPANGMYLVTANSLAVSAAGSLAMQWTNASVSFTRTLQYQNSATGPAVIAASATATVPTLVPNRAATTTGIGSQATGNLSEIIAGAEIGRWTSTGPLFVVLPTDAATTDNTLCVNTTTHIVSFGSGTLGICLGTSSVRYKRDVATLDWKAATSVAALRPVRYRYKPGYGDSGARENYWLIAEDVVKILPQCVPLDGKKLPSSVDPVCIEAFLIKALQEKSLADAVQFARLELEISSLRKKK